MRRCVQLALPWSRGKENEVATLANGGDATSKRAPQILFAPAA